MWKINNIDDYISLFTLDKQIILNNIRKNTSLLSSSLVESISYWIATLKLNNKIVIHFAGFKNHIWIYPGPKTIEHFEKELINYKTSKWAIQFQLKDNINYELINKIAKYNIDNILNEK